MVHVVGMQPQIGVKPVTIFVGCLEKVFLPAVGHGARQKVQAGRIAHQPEFEHVRGTLSRSIADAAPDRVRRIGWTKVPVKVARRNPHILRQLIPPVPEQLCLRFRVGRLVCDRRPEQLSVDGGERLADQTHAGQNAVANRQRATAVAVVLVRTGRVLAGAPYDGIAHRRHGVGQTGREIVPLRLHDIRKGTDVLIRPVLIWLGIVEGQTNRYAEAIHKAGKLFDRLGVGKPAFEL